MNTATMARRIKALETTTHWEREFSLNEIQDLGTETLRRVYAAAMRRCLELDPTLTKSEFRELTTVDNVTQLVPRRNYPAAMTRAALNILDTLTVNRSEQISEETIEWGGFLSGYTVHGHNHSEIANCILAA